MIVPWAITSTLNSLMMLEILFGGLTSTNYPADLVAPIICQNCVNLPRGRLAAKGLTSDQEFVKQTIRGRGSRGVPNSQDGIQLQYI